MRVRLTAARVGLFECPAGKGQAFLWDSTAPGLALRVTEAGSRAYIFQSRYQSKALRITIGSVDAWRIPEAQERARELQRQIDEGRDPREVKAATVAVDVQQRQRARGQTLTVAEVWPRYMAEGKPRCKSEWKPRYFTDL